MSQNKLHTPLENNTVILHKLHKLAWRGSVVQDRAANLQFPISRGVDVSAEARVRLPPAEGLDAGSFHSLVQRRLDEAFPEGMRRHPLLAPSGGFPEAVVEGAVGDRLCAVGQ